MINYCGASMFTLASETDKLAYYVLQNGRREVTAEDVEFLSPKDETSSTPQGKAQDAEEKYRAEEREAIQREKEYVDVTGDDLPFD